jgi:hypothetical protein
MTNALRAQGTYLQRGAASTVTPQTISTITSVGSLATVTTSVAHGLTTGANVTITGATPAAYNGTYGITVLTTTTFTYTASSAPGGAASVVGTYTAQNIAYAELEEATDIKIGGISISSIDATHLRSTAKEFIPGLADNGMVDISCNFTNGTVQNLIRADGNAAVTSPYRVLVVSGVPGAVTTTTFGFSAFVMKYAGPDAKIDSELQIQISLKVTGALTVTTA